MTTASITQCGVNDTLTPKSRSRVVETDAYGAFSRRVLRGYSRRIANAISTHLAVSSIWPTISTLTSELQSQGCGMRLLVGRYCGPGWHVSSGCPAALGRYLAVTSSTVTLTPDTQDVSGAEPWPKHCRLPNRR